MDGCSNCARVRKRSDDDIGLFEAVDSRRRLVDISRTAAEVGVLLGDRGYDDQQIRALARENHVRPLIKHREFSSLQKAWNARLDTERYDQRSQSETVNSQLKRKYGAFVRSRRWWTQFRELALARIVHNLDRILYRSVQPPYRLLTDMPKLGTIVAFGSFYSIVFINRCHRERRVRVAGERRKDFRTPL